MHQSINRTCILLTFIAVLGVTILLSLTVFMLQLAEALPPVSDAVSIIGLFIFVVSHLVICFKLDGLEC